MAIEVEVRRRRFTLNEYHRMGEAGILTEDDRVELIRGEIVQMTPIGSRHAAGVARLNERFVRDLSGRDREPVSPGRPGPGPSGSGRRRRGS